MATCSLASAPVSLHTAPASARLRRPLPLAAALMIASSGGGVAQSAPERAGEDALRIHGRVIDAENRAPVAGARVWITGSEWVSVSNREGRFMLYRMDPGFHTVSVKQLGYRTLVAQAEATADGTPLELSIQPDPIVLEGLEVVTRRFALRRRSAGIRVIELDQQELAAAGESSAGEMLATRIPVQRAVCREGGYDCIRVRGVVVRPRIYIDEAPMLDGWTAIEAYSPQDFHMVEIYGWGGHIRAYTHAFMERASRTRFLPVPIGF